MSQSAQLRVYAWDQARLAAGGFSRRAAALRSLMRAPTCLDIPLGQVRVQWGELYKRSFLLRIDDNRTEFERNICKLAHLRTTLGVNDQHAQKTFRAAAYQRILQQCEPNAEFRVRHKLERWGLGIPSRHIMMNLSVKQLTPAWTSIKTLHNLHLLQQLVAPRVVAACFSTVWNRWTTARRFQQRSHRDNCCQLG